MTPLALAIVATMVALQPPGRSIYSKVDGELETFEVGARRYATIASAIDLEAGDDAELRALMLGVVYHESGFRRDVHAGDESGRGDKGASWCLGQHNMGKTSAAGRRLVGLDPAATARCIRATADGLRRSRRYCRRYVGEQGVHCVFAVYGGLDAMSKHRGVLARVRSYTRARKYHAMTAETKAALCLDAS